MVRCVLFLGGVLGLGVLLVVGGPAGSAGSAGGRAGRVEAVLPRGAAVELRLHGLIERSVSLVVLVFLHLLVLSASAFHLGALPSVKARAACAISK